MIYFFYQLLAVALIWGARGYGKGKWNEEAFSLRQMKALQGFSAICIMLHHIGQKTCASWLESSLIIPGLESFVPVGYFFVGLFLFCSGYGLYKSSHEKPDYFKHFGRKRILPLVIAFYSTGLLFLLVRFLMKEPLSGWNVFFYASGLKLSNPNSWYVIVLPFFYLAFYLAFRFCKKDWLSITWIILFTIAYQLLGTIVDHNDFWMQGEWWYNSIHLFPLGILFSKHEEKITTHLKKWYWLYFSLFLLGISIFYPLSEFAQWRFSYYCDGQPLPFKLKCRWICLLTQLLASCSFVFFLFLCSMKVRIGNRFLAFMGSITLEFYLIHGLFLELFSYNFVGEVPSLHRITNMPLLILVVFLPSIPAAMLLHKLDHVFQPKGKQKSKASDNAS